MSGKIRRRIVLVTSGLGTLHGGIGVVSHSILRALRADHDVDVWLHPVALPRPLRIGFLAARALLGSLHAPDFIFYEHVHLAALHRTLPSLQKVPYGVFLHGIEVWQPLVGRRREALVNANILVANSATTVTMAREVNRWLPEVKVTWLGVTVGDPTVCPGELPPTATIVGRMASLERLKGHDAVLDAWPAIRRAVPDAHLVIVGTGNDRLRLEARVRQENLPGVEFRGRLSDAERDRIYQTSRLFFFPSKGEGFGLAGVEAAGWGVPLLGLRGTVMDELFPNGCAIFAGDVSAGAIADAAIPVLRDSQLANTVGRSGRQRVRQTFLEEHFLARFRAALEPLPEGQPVSGNFPSSNSPSFRAGHRTPT
jgi:phosphatidylinositol alpha-1,6-mannosyltransferase